MIKVTLDDTEVLLTQGQMIKVLLEQATLQHVDRIAIAVNNRVIPRPQWPSHQLNDNDQVLMIAPIQGG